MRRRITTLSRVLVSLPVTAESTSWLLAAMMSCDCRRWLPLGVDATCRRQTRRGRDVETPLGKQEGQLGAYASCGHTHHRGGRWMGPFEVRTSLSFYEAARVPPWPRPLPSTAQPGRPPEP
jgi:hypothetical protein